MPTYLSAQRAPYGLPQKSTFVSPLEAFMRIRRLRPCALLVVILGVFSSQASIPWTQQENASVGFQNNHPFESGHSREDIDLLNGNLHLTIPGTSDPASRSASRLQAAPYRTLGAGVNLPTPNAVTKFTYYHLDHLGTPRVLLDNAGNVISRHHYMPYGEEMPFVAQGSTTKRQFTGHERDPESGLDYMRARYYSASLGRFIGADPGDDLLLGDPQTWNTYVYVRNNPLVGIDPSGEDTVIVDVKVNGGPPVNPGEHLIVHQIVATTDPPTAQHPNGVVRMTGSWHSNDDPQMGKNAQIDTKRAQDALDTGQYKQVGDASLDPFVEDQIDKRQAPDYPKHPWGCPRTCKGEAQKVVKDAKKEQAKAKANNDPEQAEQQQKGQWVGDLEMTPNTQGPHRAGDRPRVLVDGVDTSSP
jgi:RHS repeat-associated protein